MSGFKFNLGALPGNGALARQLSAKESLSHAYILSGPPGSGKHALAVLLAQAMVCAAPGERPCLHCPACRKAAAGIHPDVTTVAPAEGKRDIVVEQIRALRSDAYIRPNEAPRKVYIIEDAPAMNPSAQNALLKVLEEGPPYAAFLLLADNAGLLLPTIRSRCETLHLIPPADGPEEAGPGAEELAGLLLAGTELALMEKCAGLEKLDREALTALLDGTAAALTRRAEEDPAAAPRALAAADLVKKLRAAAAFYVGGGHLCGWLCAALFAGSSG